MGTSAWELFSQSQSYHTSSDASLFSISLNQPKHDFQSGNKLGSDSLGNKSLEDGENHVVGSLLPDDEDELLDLSMDGFDIGWLPSLIDDSDEYDIFGSGGGLEMGSDYQEHLGVGLSNLCLSDNGVGEGLAYSGLTNGVGAVAGEHPLGEHPSRTLFVRNINSNAEDAELRTLFEQYGDIRTLYTACKHRGFVMISYYDIRAARTAMKSLQNKPLRKRKLDIHFSIPKENPSDKDINQGTLVAFNLDPSVTNDDLRQIFGAYGEVKEIRETPHKRHHKFIEFYDVRAAEAALKSLNRSDIAGKRIKLEPSHPGGARRSLLQHLNHDLEEDERNSHQVGSHGNSPPAIWPQFGSPMERNSLQSFSKSPGFNSLSPSLGSSLSGLASVSQPRVSNQRVGPTGKDGLVIFEQSHPFPEQILGQFAGSSLRPFPGLQDFMGSPKLNAGQTNSAPRTQTMRNPFIPTGSNGSLFPNVHGSFRSSSQHHYQYHFGSAPSDITPEQRVYGVGGSFGSANSASSANVSRNSMDNGSPVFSVMSSPRHSPMFLGNGHFLGPPTSNLEILAERGWSRRVESNGVHMDDKKQFQLDLDKIRSGEDTRTTLMIKNIPNKYTSNMLLATIDEHHKGTYDFLYLPIDFKNKCNVGYAFINMLSPSNVICFYEAFNGKKWEKFNSEKIASLAFARIQGKAALIAHFQNSSLMNEDKRCRPILFTSESPELTDKSTQENIAVYYSSGQPRQSSGSGPLNLSGSAIGRTSGDHADKREDQRVA